MKSAIKFAASLIVCFSTLQSAVFAEDIDTAASKKYVQEVMRMARSGNPDKYDAQGSDAGEAIANLWLLVDRNDVTTLIADVDQKAFARFKKHDLQGACDRLYCGLDCAAMFGRSLAWGNGHLEGVDLNQAKPLVWLDSFAQMDIDEPGYPQEKSFAFPVCSYIAAVNNYAYYMQLLGKHQEMIPVFKKIVELDPSRTVAYINLADSLWATGEKDEAGRVYKQYLKLCQEHRYDSVPDRARDRLIVSSQR